jgi:nucleoside-diphosphate-sugar epimerase
MSFVKTPLFKMKKIIITGATGFVGSNLAKFYLDKKEFKIYLIVRDNSDLSNIDSFRDKVELYFYNGKIENLIEFFQNIKPETVFHLASNFIAEHESNQIDSLVESNITFGLHVLEAMKVAGVKKLINTGTSWQHYKNEDYNPACLYAATKEAFEKLIEYYVQAEDFKVITLKLFDTYGETDKRPKLINLLNKFADEQTELNMSPGEQVLNLVYISDVCEAYYKAFELIQQKSFTSHNHYSVESNKSLKLKDIISLFEKITGKSIKVEWGGKPYRKREVMSIWSKGQRLPNWKPLISLEEGLSRYKLK